MTTQMFYRTVARTGHQQDREVVKRATAAVLHALRDRLTTDEADQVFAQLPEELKEIWAEGEEAEREPIKMKREEFYERVVRDAGLPSKRQARWMILAVFAAQGTDLAGRGAGRDGAAPEGPEGALGRGPGRGVSDRVSASLMHGSGPT
jgi:uncharacterized protein (DUF2267 family)